MCSNAILGCVSPEDIAIKTCNPNEGTIVTLLPT